MKYRFTLPILLLLCIADSYAQNQKTTAFAITSASRGTAIWTEVKMIDLSSGEIVQTIYDNTRSNVEAFNARNGKVIRIKDEQGRITDQQYLPFSTLSAACAYDRRHNRLYYTPMYLNQLRYIDLDKPNKGLHYFENETFSGAANLTNEANHITRMVIASDGNGYALSNDGRHLVRFTTGRKPVITDLGSLTDDPANNGISIHTKATSWGGDMIADASGSLYVISAQRAVFRIDLLSRRATYINTISGMPVDYTTNGAAVAANGKLVVSSATSTDAYYEVDMKTWQASRIRNNGPVFNTSDLANGNLATIDETSRQEISLIDREIIRNTNISVYPNPVSEGIFRVSFNNRTTGRHDIQLLDLTGRTITHRAISVGNQGQVEELTVPSGTASGVYFVKVLNNSKKTVFADKVIIRN